MDRFMEEQREAILDHGFTVHYSDSRSRLYQNLPWAYTVGRTLFDRPELLVVGPFVEEQMHEMLTEAVAVDQQSPIVPEQIIEAAGRRFRLLPAASDAFIGAMAMFGAINGLQLVWADPETGEFPGRPQVIRPVGTMPFHPSSDPYGPIDPFHPDEETE